MSLIGDMFKGMLLISFFAVSQQSCSTKDMAIKAADAHQRGLTSYGAYSRMLTGHKGSWAK